MKVVLLGGTLGMNTNESNWLQLTKYLSYLRSTIIILIILNVHLVARNSYNKINWMGVKKCQYKSFNHFCIHIIPNNLLQQYAILVPPQRTPSTSTHMEKDLSDFQSSIKWDKTHYTLILNEEQFDEWKRAALRTISIHCCKNITNSSYVPKSLQASFLFQNQHHLYNVSSLLPKVEFCNKLV